MTYGAPWHTISKHHVMGNKWMKTSVGANKHKQHDHMSVLIHQLLSSNEIFTKNSEDLPEIIEAADNDGYLTLTISYICLSGGDGKVRKYHGTLFVKYDILLTLKDIRMVNAYWVRSSWVQGTTHTRVTFTA